MKFKIASVLELVVPLSIAALLSAFLGCGGGAYGNGTSAYDGTWSINLKGYTLPAKATGAPGEVSCDELYTNIVISHGVGTATQVLDCVNANLQFYHIDIGVTLAPAASGIGGTAHAISTGGAIDTTGICISRVVCQDKNIAMFKCGEAASGC